MLLNFIDASQRREITIEVDEQVEQTDVISTAYNFNLLIFHSSAISTNCG